MYFKNEILKNNIFSLFELFLKKTNYKKLKTSILKKATYTPTPPVLFVKSRTISFPAGIVIVVSKPCLFAPNNMTWLHTQAKN